MMLYPLACSACLSAWARTKSVPGQPAFNQSSFKRMQLRLARHWISLEPAAETSASTSADAPAESEVQRQPTVRDERLQLPNEKGDICCLAVGGGRMALWHKPGGKALPKLAAAGATMVATLLAEREGAELIGRKARDAGLAWHWADLDGANTEYLASAEAVDVVIAAVAAIQAALGRGDSVLVHCSAGLHRTGTVGYAVMRASGWSRDEAREGLRRMRDETANKVDEVGSGNAKGGGRLDIVDRLVLDRVTQRVSQKSV